MYMYNVCTCTMYVHVQCMYMYNVCTCTMYVHVQCMYMYNVCTCTMYVHVQCMNVLCMLCRYVTCISVSIVNCIEFLLLFLPLSLTEDVQSLKEPHEGPTKFFTIKILSSRESVTVAVDGSTVSGRGSCCHGNRVRVSITMWYIVIGLQSVYCIDRVMCSM